ncbi:Na+-driven multidrug efflux pump [Xylanibacter ruminicola]|uniref:Na+-driven multidrug efflux pump n=2 Tax=Xylanibacter ruminicola TaxID=839 RepID=A0A1M6R7M0_XYLRU|nr:Na+-driven multidrug efflux pump [Xylanibacter ruminicola]
MVALMDFGFAPQIGRNITYALSGSKHIEREGLHGIPNLEPNYRLLATVIEAAKFIYKRLSILILILMLTFGTYYIDYVTNGFDDVDNSLWIWLLFSLSNYLNIYFIYYRSLLTGSGKIFESSVSIILSKLTYIIICVIFISSGFGLISIVIANMVSPLVLFVYSHFIFFTKEIRKSLPTDIKSEEKKEAISSIWFNAKKLGINQLGTFAILKLNLFLIGLFLPLSVVGSFGILTQVVPALSAVATSLFNSFLPQIASLQVAHNFKEITKKLSITVLIFWMIMIIGGIAIVICLPWIMDVISSNTKLPPTIVTVLYLIVMALEGNHTMFSTVIVTSNKVPFVAAGLVSGFFIGVLTFISLRFTTLGLVGVVLAQGIIQLLYNNWRWPKYVLDEFNIKPIDFIRMGYMGFCKIRKNNLI